jgi:hypothetical protein
MLLLRYFDVVVVVAVAVVNVADDHDVDFIVITTIIR